MRYWLMKSEPDEFSITDLKNRPDQTEGWDGVRNYQARNFMRDDMQKGDKVFFYHSNCEQPGIVGIATIAREASPDPTAFDPDDAHYDPKSDPNDPRWVWVHVKFERELKRIITLKELKELADNQADNQPDKLDGLALIRRGNRLSIMPVSAAHWKTILSLE